MTEIAALVGAVLVAWLYRPRARKTPIVAKAKGMNSKVNVHITTTDP